MSLCFQALPRNSQTPVVARARPFRVRGGSRRRVRGTGGGGGFERGRGSGDGPPRPPKKNKKHLQNPKITITITSSHDIITIIITTTTINTTMTTTSSSETNICTKCGYQWSQRKAGRPVACPECKSRRWDEGSGADQPESELPPQAEPEKPAKIAPEKAAHVVVHPVPEELPDEDLFGGPETAPVPDPEFNKRPSANPAPVSAPTKPSGRPAKSKRDHGPNTRVAPASTEADKSRYVPIED